MEGVNAPKWQAGAWDCPYMLLQLWQVVGTYTVLALSDPNTIWYKNTLLGSYCFNDQCCLKLYFLLLVSSLEHDLDWINIASRCTKVQWNTLIFWMEKKNATKRKTRPWFWTCISSPGWALNLLTYIPFISWDLQAQCTAGCHRLVLDTQLGQIWWVRGLLHPLNKSLPVSCFFFNALCI